MKIFGREIPLWLSLVAAVVMGVAALTHITADQQAVVNAVAAAIAGLIVAVATHDGASAAALGLVKAVLALALGFGLHLGSAQQVVIMTLAAAIVAMYVRTQAIAPVTATGEVVK